MQVIHWDWCTGPLRTAAGLLALLCALPLSAQSKTEPLPDGLILKSPVISEKITGTIRSLNATLSKDLAPIDNAAVFLVQTFGDDIFEPELRDQSLEMLGIQSLSPTAPRFAFLEPYVKNRDGAKVKNVRVAALELQSSVLDASEQIWTREDFADAADYLQANHGALNAIVSLTNKPRYFVPMLSAEVPPSLLSASKVLERRLPFVARTLSARGLLRFGANDFEAGLADLIAGHKLAALLATGSPMDTSVAQAHLADAFVARADLTLVRSGKLTGPQAKTFSTALGQIPLLLNAARAADIGERAILHREIEILKANEVSFRGFFDIPETDAKETDKKDPPPPMPAIKWDLAMKRADEIQNRIVEALSTRDRAAQNKLFDQLDADYLKWMNTSDDTARKFAESTELDVDAASKWVGETMAMSLRPLYRQRRASEDRVCQRRDLVMIGLALIAFRHDHGEYPAALGELVPGYMKTLTAEADAVETFTYTREAKDHIRLVSSGVNRQDDAGKAFNDDETLELH